MRVRMIRPAYWTDADLHTRLTAEQREFYVGLWMLADDEGYVAWDPERVGAELYPYRSPAWRSKRLADWLAMLGVEHARLLPCGRHVVIPNLPKYQSPPKPTSQVKRAHDACIRDAMGAHVAPLDASGHQVAAARGFSKEGKGREGEGRADARDIDNEGTTFDDRMRANGVHPAIAGRRTA